MVTRSHVSPGAQRSPPPPAMDTTSSQEHVINYAIQWLLQRREQSQNILTQGYRMLRGNRSKAVAGTVALENFFPNTVVNHLKSPLWETLLSRIGDYLMTYLLTCTSLFVATRNNCCFQVSGIPICELKPKMKIAQTNWIQCPSNFTLETTRPGKRSREAKEDTEQDEPRLKRTKVDKPDPIPPFEQATPAYVISGHIYDL
ncbi:hypothetical protein HDV05_002300 [Chytridiales sp. JEL 0842]|nr:hypothetical protein HDV05_002300 [Chytridiales sp. JEL 0842]